MRRISSRRPAVRAAGVLAAATALTFGTPSPPTEATVLVPVDVHGLVDEAEVIFVGAAVHEEVAATGDGKFPFTLVTFRVEESLKGSSPLGELTLALPGGELGGEIFEILGTPRFAVGERYVVFARGNGTRRFPIVGWHQGVLRLVRDGQSGAPIVTDTDGRAIAGLAGASWVKKEETADGAESGIAVLRTHGVAISPVAPATGGDAAPAAGILAELRSTVRARAGLATFRPGRAIASARPQDLPFTLSDAPEETP